MKITIKTILCAAALLLVACQSKQSQPLAGVKLILTGPLVIAAGFTHLSFQDDGPIRPLDVDDYQPYCQLETQLTATGSAPFEIESDELEVLRVDFVAPDGYVGSNSANREGIRYMTNLRLSSANQPFIDKLACQRWTNKPGEKFLQLQDIEQILGNAGKFIL